jgi:hypothetical protein
VRFGEVVIDGGSPVKVKGEVHLHIVHRKFTFDILPDPSDPRSEKYIGLVKARLEVMYDIWQALDGVEVVGLLDS